MLPEFDLDDARELIDEFRAKARHAQHGRAEGQRKRPRRRSHDERITRSRVADDGALGGGWTMTAQNLTIAPGGNFSGQSVSFEILSDRTTCIVAVKVNGEIIAL